VCQIRTRRPGSGYGSGWRRTLSTTEKIAVFAPIPSARTTIAAALNPRLFVRFRNPRRRS
jgi:hypothetical protein